MDTRLVELWLRLTADGLKGAGDAQRALEALGSNPLTPAALSEWMRLWLPEDPSTKTGPSASDLSDFETMVESWWRLLGVVPRYQYDELERRYEELGARLEEADGTIRRLRAALASGGREAEAQAMLDSWDRLTRQALDAQAEWAKHWLTPWSNPRRGESSGEG